MTENNETVVSLGNLSLITNASMFSDILTRQTELSEKVMKAKGSFDEILLASEERPFQEDAKLNNLAILFSEARQGIMKEMRDWYVEAARKLVESAVDQAQFDKREKRIHAIVNGWKSVLSNTCPLGMDEVEDEEDAEWMADRGKKFPERLMIPANSPFKAPHNSAISERLRSKSKSVASAISGVFTPPRSSTPEGGSKGGRKKSAKGKSPRRKSLANAQKQKGIENDDVFEEEEPPASNDVEIVDEVAASGRDGEAFDALKGEEEEEEKTAPALPSSAIVDEIIDALGENPLKEESAERKRRAMEETTKKMRLQMEDMKKELAERQEKAEKAAEERRKLEKEVEEARKKEKEEEEKREKERKEEAKRKEKEEKEREENIRLSNKRMEETEKQMKEALRLFEELKRKLEGEKRKHHQEEVMLVKVKEQKRKLSENSEKEKKRREEQATRAKEEEEEERKKAPREKGVITRTKTAIFSSSSESESDEDFQPVISKSKKKRMRKAAAARASPPPAPMKKLRIPSSSPSSSPSDSESDEEKEKKKKKKKKSKKGKSHRALQLESLARERMIQARPTKDSEKFDGVNGINYNNFKQKFFAVSDVDGINYLDVLNELPFWLSGTPKTIADAEIGADNPKEAVKTIWKSLDKFFSMFTRSISEMIEPIIQKPQVEEDDMEALVELTAELGSVESEAKRMGLQKELDLGHIISRIVSKRIPHLAETFFTKEAEKRESDEEFRFKFADLQRFIQTKATVLKATGKTRTYSKIAAMSESGPQHYHHPQQRTPPQKIPPSKVSCRFCKAKHETEECEKLLKMGIEERAEALNKNGFCIKCLEKGHKRFDCKKNPTCAKCDRPGHQMLLHGLPTIQRRKYWEAQQAKAKEEAKNKPKQAEQDKAAEEEAIK